MRTTEALRKMRALRAPCISRLHLRPLRADNNPPVARAWAGR